MRNVEVGEFVADPWLHSPFLRERNVAAGARPESALNLPSSFSLMAFVPILCVSVHFLLAVLPRDVGV